MADKITYLIANYNNGKYIKDCIQSLLDQTNDNWLAIICNDASTDNSISIIEAMPDYRITLIRNDQNLGFGLTTRKLIDSAQTEILAMLDADDALYPETTEELLLAFKRFPWTGFVYSKYDCYDEQLQNIIETRGKTIARGRTSLEGGFVGHIRAFRKSVYDKTEGIDEKILGAEDRDIIYKMEEVTKPVALEKALYKYRHVPKSISNESHLREIGAQNHRKAKENALDRRGVRGMKRKYYQMIMTCDDILFLKKYHPLRKKGILIIKAILIILDKIFSIRNSVRYD